jgi:outer membrane protein insertion porin family
MSIRYFIILVVFSLFFMVKAQSFAAEIGKIEFVQSGDYKFQNKMLNFYMQSKPGTQFSEKLLNDDIKRLYSTGYFSDIVTESSKQADGKINVTLKISARPRVKKIIFSGNQKFKTADLQKEISVVVDMPLNDNKLRLSANKIREFYKGKGYNEAQVSTTLKAVGKGWIEVVFNVTENLRLKIDNVKFEGATVYSQWTLKNTIANRHSYLSWLLDYGLFDKGELKNDKLRLRELYWNKGYLDFKVEKVSVVPDSKNPEYVNLTFHIYEGKPYKIKTVTIAGNKIYQAEELLPLLALDKDEVFDNLKVTQARNNVAAKYEEQGYADFSCRVNRLPNFKEHTVDLDFIVNEGRKFFVQDVNISGNRLTKDKVIRRELAIQPGDPLDKNRIEASKNRLMGMGYFKKVDTVTIGTDNPGEKDVNFQVEEKETFEFKIGGGFSDSNSLVGMVQLSNSNFDITNPKNYFYGGGQRFRVQGMFGIDRNNFNVDFTEPWLFDIPLRWDISGYWNMVEYNHWSERRIGAKTSLTKRVYDDFTSVAVGYKFENVRIYDMDSRRSKEMRKEKGRDWVSQLSVLLNRDTRDSLTEPTSGYQVSTLAAVSPKVAGSTYNFYRLEAKGVYYKSFFEKAIIGRVAGKVGTVSSFDRGDSVPLYERYFLGGGNSLRGFEYRRVSPTDINDDAIGGESMALLSFEVTHPIWSFVRGAVFLDAGYVGSNSFCFSMNQINVGAGYGLRIKVPYLNAPVNLDLAYPIIKNQDDLKSKMRFHFNMGFTW